MNKIEIMLEGTVKSSEIKQTNSKHEIRMIVLEDDKGKSWPITAFNCNPPARIGLKYGERVRIIGYLSPKLYERDNGESTIFLSIVFKSIVKLGANYVTGE